MAFLTYLMETITNLHVGDLGGTASIVDNTVQRDAVTGYPCVHATSLKGALRDAAKNALDTDVVNRVFGNPPPGAGASRNRDTAKGTYNFMDARMLFYPVRSHLHAYYLATCPVMLKDAVERLAFSGRQAAAGQLQALLSKETGKVYMRNANPSQARVEHMLMPVARADDEVIAILNGMLAGEDAIALISDSDMNQVMDALPVIARNKLNNGISQTLWYEEYVPRKSRFLTAFIMPDNDKDADAFNGLLTNSPFLQIGGSATVGYGVCRFARL